MKTGSQKLEHVAGVGASSDHLTARLQTQLRDKNLHIDEMEARHRLQANRMKQLEQQLSRRDAEMAAMEERYKKYLHKAKAVVRMLDGSAPSTSSSSSSCQPVTAAASIDVGVLQHQLAEKERLLGVMEKEKEKVMLMRETEDRLMSTALYNIVHNQTVGQRSSATTGALAQPSFLTRHRQATVRRPLGNSDFYDY